jgi:AcrR family transcriptional regulator
MKPMKPKRATAPRITGGRITGAPGQPRPTQNIRWGDDETPVTSDDARGRIVTAALECVQRFGVDKTGMDDVARAAAITRPTVYKYFPTRNELIMAVFLRALDERLEKGLQEFFNQATSVEELRDGVAESMVYLLDVLRTDETIQAVLYGSRIPVEVLLNETAAMLVGALRLGLGSVVDLAIAHDLTGAVRPFVLEDAAAWVIRILYSFLVWPGADADVERAMLRDFLSPVFFLDPA